MRGILARAVLDAQNDRLAPWNLGASLLMKAGSVLDTVGDVGHLVKETVSIATIVTSAGSGPVPAAPLVSSPTDSTISRPADICEEASSAYIDSSRDGGRDERVSDAIDDWSNAKADELEAAARKRSVQNEDDSRRGSTDR